MEVIMEICAKLKDKGLESETKFNLVKTNAEIKGFDIELVIEE